MDGKVRKACNLKIIPEEISLVQLIFEKFLEIGFLTKVDAFLPEKQYTTKRGKDFIRIAKSTLTKNKASESIRFLSKLHRCSNSVRTSNQESTSLAGAAHKRMERMVMACWRRR